jgi:RimJ/RimL family protein N-acetyltransferase
MAIGYWCRTACVGQGYVTEAVRVLAALAFDTLGAQRVEIRCDVRNARSRAVAERAGFAQEGVQRNEGRTPLGELRDTVVYALTPADRARL